MADGFAASRTKRGGGRRARARRPGPSRAASPVATAGALARAPGLRDIFDALPIAVYTTDAAGRITFYNEPAAILAGRRPTLGVDEWCVTWRLLRPDGAPLPHDECPMAIALKQDRAVRSGEAIALRPDGTRTPFLAFPTPLHDSSGALVGAINVLVDVSERQAAQARQRALFAELNHRIKNNMQLLHALLGAAQRETESAEARAAIAGAVQRVDAMAAAQKALYQAGHDDGFSAEEFLALVCETSAQPFGEAVTLSCRACEAELGNDMATPLALILNELVTDAARRACDAGVRARIGVELARGPQGGFVLGVEDDAPGAPPAAQGRRSSGLGLALGLAAQIGGALEVERASKTRCVLSIPDPGAAA